jgi:hypothetical protein
MYDLIIGSKAGSTGRTAKRQRNPKNRRDENCDDDDYDEREVEGHASQDKAATESKSIRNIEGDRDTLLEIGRHRRNDIASGLNRAVTTGARRQAWLRAWTGVRHGGWIITRAIFAIQMAAVVI